MFHAVQAESTSYTDCGYFDDSQLEIFRTSMPCIDGERQPLLAPAPGACRYPAFKHDYAIDAKSSTSCPGREISIIVMASIGGPHAAPVAIFAASARRANRQCWYSSSAKYTHGDRWLRHFDANCRILI